MNFAMNSLICFYSSSSGFKWDPQRSPRWNQDAQREEGRNDSYDTDGTLDHWPSGAGCTKGGKRYPPDSGFFKHSKIVHFLYKPD